MLPFRLVYHEGYDLNLGGHVFPSRKYRWLRDRMLQTGFAGEDDFVAPNPIPEADLMLAHDAAWVRKLRDGALSYSEILRLEIPYSRRMVDGFFLAAAGTTLAARLALDQSVCYHLGGGFHHAFAGRGEGFCAINDMAVAIRVLERDALIRRAMVVDCDVHHGNGTASIFARDPSVFTLSIHQLDNYPAEKPPSDVDIDLDTGTGDWEYLERLRAGLTDALARFSPDLMIYVAGADPYRDDQLGGLDLTFQGLEARDRQVIGTALQRRIPVAIVLAGGYARNVEDTIAIHAATAAVARDLLRSHSARPVHVP
jgi:acetoin utilization deacetylase AcuC-like enzyme